MNVRVNPAVRSILIIGLLAIAAFNIKAEGRPFVQSIPQVPEGALNVCTWSGSVSDAWANGGNWTGCGGVQPQPGDSVIIGAGAPNDPLLTTTAPTTGNLGSVTVNSAGRLDISASGVLNTNVDFSLNGGRLRFFFDGTMNVGPTTETNLIYTTGAQLIFVPGATGALNIGGRLSPSVNTDTITYNQTSGTVRVAMFASNDSNFGAFSIPASGSTFQLSGTAAIIQREPTAVAQDYVNLAATSNSVTGGLVQFGDGSTVTGSPTYALNTSAPVFNLTLSAVAGLRVNIRNNTVPILGTLSILTGARLDDADAVPKGATVGGDWINNGTFTSQGTLGGSGLITLNGGATQNISGSTSTTFHDLTINSSGIALAQTITVTGTLTLTSGNITTNSNTVVVTSTGTVSRTSGHVIGNLQKTYTGAASKTFEVGTANGYSPVDVNVTAGSGDFTVSATQGPEPHVVTPGGALQRYWTLTAAGMTADLTFHYLDPPDVPATITESSLVIFKWSGAFSMPGGSVNTAANTATINGVSSFSNWTLAGPNAPTVTSAAITGRIVDNNGNPVEGAVVRLSGAQNRKVITDANGFYRFQNVETNGFYTVTPTRSNYNFNPFNRSFNQVGNTTEATFSGNLLGDSRNPSDTAEYFVRRQYLDILNREPDEAGFNYWSDQILACGEDADCTRAQRTGVAAAFFIENEFRQSGAFIYNVYESALGRRPAYVEYSADRTNVVGGSTLDTQKGQFAAAFVSRADFVNRYQNNTSGESFVDALLGNARAAGIDLSAERDSLIARYSNGISMTESRALVLRDVSESSAVRDANYNAAFVEIEYFGYLHRTADTQGREFWLNVLNESGSNGNPSSYRGMVCSFITSTEYQRRFSSVVSHSNTECGQ